MFTFMRQSPSVYKYFVRFISNCQRTPISKTVELPDRPFVLDGGHLARRPLQLHYWEWQGHKPTVLLCHAGSFHSRCYDSIIEQAFPTSHVISIDFRGHGRSQKHSTPYHLRWFGKDLAEFIKRLALDNIVGVGHSLGGYSLVLAASMLELNNEKSRFRSLLLLDPVILPREMYVNEDSQIYKNVIAIFEPHRRRKTQWSSVEDMMEYMAKREPFSRWPLRVLRDYCLYAIDNHFTLICSPDIEVSLYTSCINDSAQIYDDIYSSNNLNDISVYVIRCSKPCLKQISMDASFTEPNLASYFAQGHDIVLENTTHLFPMEKPHLVINLLKDINL